MYTVYFYYSMFVFFIMQGDPGQFMSISDYSLQSLSQPFHTLIRGVRWPDYTVYSLQTNKQTGVKLMVRGGLSVLGCTYLFKQTGLKFKGQNQDFWKQLAQLQTEYPS